MEEIGMRVFVIQKANAKTVHLIGFGTYDGDHVPESGALHDAGIPNPRITLDDGRVIWGHESWWGSEDRYQEFVGNRKVVDARP